MKRSIDKITGGSGDHPRPPPMPETASSDFAFGDEGNGDWLDDDGPPDLSLSISSEGAEVDLLRAYSGDRCVSIIHRPVQYVLIK